MTCRYVATDQPRVLPGRHGEDCADACRGCLACPDRHCVVCYTEHVDAQTCPSCIARTRGELSAVLELAGMLPDQAANAGSDGRLAAAKGAAIIGGDAMVMLAPGSLGTQADDHSHESDADPMPPLLVLATWEDDWRDTFRHGGGPRATLANASAYLTRHMSTAAQEHPAFDEFAAEVRRLRARLEGVLGAGTSDEEGVPCLHCTTTLVRKSDDKTGLRDEWDCPRCHRVYPWDRYHNAVKAAYIANAKALTSEHIHERYGVPKGSVRGWATKGQVRRRGRDHNGRQLYDVADVERVLGSRGEVSV